MKEIFKLNFNLTKETLYAVLAGLLAIGLSLIMKTKIVENSTLAILIVRDVLMIVGIGVVFVLNRINRSQFKEYGLTFDKGLRDFIINIVLAVLLAFVMISGLKQAGKEFVELNSYTFSRALYIILAGIFEAMFFYTYQRVVFEKSFGKIPSIVLVSLFYSFHHAGFQPEFLKLFFVGISFVLVVSITKSIWSIFPFYWSVGALLDVLVQSDVVSPIPIPFIRSITIITLMITAFTIYIIKNKKGSSLIELDSAKSKKTA